MTYHMIFIEFLILVLIKLNKKGQPFLWDSGESGTLFMCEWEWVSASLSITLMDGVGWASFLVGGSGHRWVEVYLGECGWVDISYGWMSVGGGDWRQILGGWGGWK